MPDSTTLNTLALEHNTQWIIVSTLVAIVLFFITRWGYKKYQTKNIIKQVINKKGEISQGEGENTIEDVDNTDGIIKQN